MESLPRTGPALVAVSHSFATYDVLMLGAKIFLETGRYGAGLADRRVFQTPGLAQFFSRIGTYEGSPETAESILREGKLLVLSPGGMRESIRPSTDKYRVDWDGRMGFVRLALKMQVPVLLAACPAADDIYTLYENPVTPAFYKKFKWPLPVLRGWGPTLAPRPVKLAHYLSQPYSPPALRDGHADENDVKTFHAFLVAEMQKLMQNR